jgi:DNA-binding NtrC family response regulator
MKSVLIVDDDLAVLDIARRMLTAAGYEVLQADNGKTALASYSERPTDVVVTDVVMPEMEGLETIRELRRLDPHARIVAMTGADPQFASTYLAMAGRFGALEILRKPFTKEQLLAAVAKALEI